MYIRFDRKTRRRQNALGGFHIGAVKPETFGELQPAFDAAFAAHVAVMIFDSVAPFLADGPVPETRDHDRVLDRYRALIKVAVQRPRLDLSLVQLAAVQQPMERMQVVVAHRADMAQRRFQFLGVSQRRAVAARKGGHSIMGKYFRGHRFQSVISVPSAAICHPARSAISRSSESCSSAGLEMLICKKIFRAMSRPARVAIAPASPDIAICPMPWPVLLPSPAAISSSSRHTVPSKKTSGAPASRAFTSSVTAAQAATK